MFAISKGYQIDDVWLRQFLDIGMTKKEALKDPLVRFLRWSISGTLPEMYALRFQNITDPDHFLVVHPSTREPGRVQVSKFDERGPYGDSVRESLEVILGRTNSSVISPGEWDYDPEGSTFMAHNPSHDERSIAWDELRRLRDEFRHATSVNMAGTWRQWAASAAVALDRYADIWPDLKRGAVREMRNDIDLARGFAARAERNPSEHPDTERACALFVEFHQFKPRSIRAMPASFEVPRTMYYVGHPTVMYYTSDKRNPSTGGDDGDVSYYHDHGTGSDAPRLYLATGEHGGEERNIPSWITNPEGTLCLIGQYDGLDFENFEGDMVEQVGVPPMPRWYATSNGKALLVIQGQSEVLAIIYGGNLRVEPRGVVG